MDLQLVSDYQHDSALRNAFFAFARTVFQADFRQWYEQGAWDSRYVCFSFLQHGQIIANASLSRMDLVINGQLREGIQLATVGTLPQYRHQGLARRLLQRIFEAYGNRFYFLFANPTVTDFYPKFGFRPVQQKTFSLPIPASRSPYQARRLDLTKPDDWQILRNATASALAVTDVFGAVGYGYALLWHCLNFYFHDVHYLAGEDMVIIFRVEQQTLHLYDILSTEPVLLSHLLPKILPRRRLQWVRLYFTPDRVGGSGYQIQENIESLLFVKGAFEPFGVDFQFPVLAET